MLRFRQSLRMEEPEEQTPCCWCGDGYAVEGGICGDRVTGGLPAIGVGQVGVLLQRPTSRWIRPRNHHAAAGVGNGQCRRAGGLHRRDETPEAAGQRVIATAHGRVRVRLTDGAADGIDAPSAGATAPGDFEPVNRVILRLEGSLVASEHDQGEQQALEVSSTYGRGDFRSHRYR